MPVALLTLTLLTRSQPIGDAEFGALRKILQAADAERVTFEQFTSGIT